ncbi:Sensor histidine kinase RcsC [Paenibacillus solanacearum]|uniref:histidine kinase n=1 Tax=Paenibacillus solanacearum TaxID=2048548 RepID=A0A916JZ82_9BACL|nr:Sensor histidine kinase RcsC [Paenibacillus solanacearum]
MIFGTHRSIFRRLLFSYMSTVLLGLCLAGLLMSHWTKDYIVHSKQEELLRKAKRINLSIQNVAPGGEGLKELLLFYDQSFDNRIWIFDRQGTIVATSSKDEVSVGKSVDASIVRKVTQGDDAVLNLQFEGLKEQMLSVVVPWGKDNQVYGGIVLHAPVIGMNETINNIRETILWVTLFGLVFSVATASYLSWSISRPLRQIDRAANRIGMGDYGGRIDIPSKDEIGDLAATINQMAEKLERIDLEKRKLEQIRQHFLANISHELRTPLTAMQGFLEALQDDLIDDTAKPRYYDIIYKETLHMSRLVDDIMDLIKLENDEIALHPSPVNVDRLIRHVVFTLQPEAADKLTEIELQVDESLPYAYADPDRLEQILRNLVKNAVKFTENGLITVKAWSSDDNLHFSVSDTGIGISEDDKELIWERFFKVDRGRSKKNSGTGLGLAIVRELVELHGGEITVDSEIGKGTSFEVRLPLQHVSAIAPGEYNHEGGNKQ